MQIGDSALIVVDNLVIRKLDAEAESEKVLMNREMAQGQRGWIADIEICACLVWISDLPYFKRFVFSVALALVPQYVFYLLRHSIFRPCKCFMTNTHVQFLDQSCELAGTDIIDVILRPRFSYPSTGWYIYYRHSSTKFASLPLLAPHPIP
ncbi:hypothetical protein BDR07DRAFT_138233 [Suillus spraguei]|nr:hypothetical protein BDR07DRAFT_138233 [Suillus spraguei]